MSGARSKLALGMLPLAVAGTLLAVWLALGEGDAARASAEAPGGGSDDDAPRAAVALEDTGAARRALRTEDGDARPSGPPAAATAPASAAPAEAPPGTGGERLVRGTVYDPGGLPLVGVALRLERHEEVAGESDAVGRFELRVPGATPSDTIVTADDGLVTVRGSRIRADGFDEGHVVVAAAAIALAGRVVDEAGEPVPRATVRVSLDPSWERRFPLPLDRGVWSPPAATSDDEGSFALSAVPAAAPGLSGSLSARAEGHEDASLELPALPSDSIVLRLPRKSGEPRVTGRVELPGGAPAPGATVQLGEERTTTDDEGAFSLPVEERLADETALVAALEGRLPAVLLDTGRVVREALPLSPAPFLLVLGGESPAIAGRLLDAEGEPLAGWVVDVTDAEPVVPNRVPLITAENVLDPYARIESDAQGRFRIGGLLDRPYTVRAYERETFRSILAPDVPAGTRDLELRLAPDVVWPRLRGVVVGADGTPVEGATVSLGFLLYRNGWSSYTDGGDPVLTGSDGGFELEQVPRERVFLSVGGQGVVPTSLDELVGAPDAVVIQVERRCRFRLVAHAGSYEDLTFEALDADDVPLQLYRFSGNGWSSAPRWPLDAERTVVHAVGETARTLRVLRGDTELARRPLHLDPVRVVELELRVP